MKRFFSLIACAVLAASCSVYTYTLNMEMREPSEAGLSLGGKSIAMAYISPDTEESPRIATRLAQNLTDSYFELDSVDVYRLERGEGNWNSKDSLVRLALDFDTDVVMVLDRSFLYVYDTMNKAQDKVYILRPVTEDYVKEFSMLLADKWRAENYSLYYADDYDEEWLDALDCAYGSDWKGAVDIWLPLVKKGMSSKCRAAAAYNLSVAFYMLEDYALSTEWLDYCDKLAAMPLSPGMRSRLVAKTR